MAKSRLVTDRSALERLRKERQGEKTYRTHKPWLLVQGVLSQESVNQGRKWNTRWTHPLLSSLEREALFTYEWLAH